MTHIEVVAAIFEAFEADGLAHAAGLLPEEIEWETPAESPEAGVSHGRAAALGSMEQWMESWGGKLQVEGLELKEIGDCVLASFTQRATGRASGAIVESRLHMLWTMRDGRPIRMQMFWDEQAARAAAVAYGRAHPA